MFEEAWIPLDKWIDHTLEILLRWGEAPLQALIWPVWATQKMFGWLFWLSPPWVLLLTTIFVWRVAGKALACYALFALSFIGWIGLWNEALVTLHLILSSLLLCVMIGPPLGIAIAKNRRFATLCMPLLDAMQTTPPFVYLVPIVMLFQIGTTSGIMATVVFGLPPLIRLTHLGLSQVPRDLVEVGLAFGASPWQLLMSIELPQAWPSIRMGFNQTVMMSLSMIVVAALIGAGGLGEPVVQGLNNLDTGRAGIGGLSVVLLAILLDRTLRGRPNS